MKTLTPEEGRQYVRAGRGNPGRGRRKRKSGKGIRFLSDQSAPG